MKDYKRLETLEKNQRRSRRTKDAQDELERSIIGKNAQEESEELKKS